LTRILLVRHGDAAPGEGGIRDDLRPLLPKGRRQVRELARGLKKSGLRFDALRHSPLLRAVETAELLTKLVDGSTCVDPRLADTPGPELVQSLSGSSLVLVGHQPYLGELVSLFVCGWKRIERGAERSPFDIEPAAACLLEGEASLGGMRVVGLYSAHALRAFSARAAGS
jgi:phosphohistidine phosphatase